ncbi:hypothetical protein L1887_18070 [Cichorium endivia]|nr:hypothetical protein L1887_18070 [Cichorium endivia]
MISMMVVADDDGERGRVQCWFDVRLLDTRLTFEGERVQGIAQAISSDEGFEQFYDEHIGFNVYDEDQSVNINQS